MASRRRDPGTVAEPEERFRRTGAAAPPPTRGTVPTDPMNYRDPGTAVPPPDWRDEVMTASGLNVLAGIWLIIAPFVLGYSNGDPYWNDIVFGAIVAVLGLVRVSGAYRASELSWINALIGVWIFISAFWLDNTTTAGWNDIILGVIVFVLGIASASASESAAATTPRWRR
jgi:hypothetical protein